MSRVFFFFTKNEHYKSIHIEWLVQYIPNLNQLYSQYIVPLESALQLSNLFLKSALSFAVSNNVVGPYKIIKQIICSHSNFFLDFV